MHNKLVLILVTVLFINQAAVAQKLGRRVSWQSSIEWPHKGKPGVKIISIEKDSPLDKAGLTSNDIIIKINNTLIQNSEIWSSIRYGIRSSETITIEALRGSELILTEAKMNPVPKETHENLETFYEEVTSLYGITQRVIITKPKKAGKQPTLVLIGGLSCSSIETYPGRKGNWINVLKDIVEKTDMVVMRIEKPGVGDSEGDCSESDFLTDLEGYRAAIKLLKSKPYVDPEKIIIYGSSMGSALAPFLANEFNLSGVISDGTFFKTWFEHMLEIERRIRAMSGDSEATITEKMNKYYIPLYYGMLIQKKSYQDIINEHPALKKYNYHSAQHMYGRPMSYYHQLQDMDLASAWEKLKVPVRIMRGTNDWIMSEFDNKMIIQTLKKNGHTDHQLHEYPGLDHWSTIHQSASDSFKGEPGKWEDNISMIIVNWAREMGGLDIKKAD